MFLVKQNIQWWDEWLVISQIFIYVITSISISRITRALCNGKLFHLSPNHQLFKMPVLQWYPRYSNLSFLHFCTYVFDVTLPMCLLFSIRYSSRSEGVVCYQSNHEWLKTKTVWYFIQYVTLKYNHIEYHSYKYWCVFFYFTVICLTIKSHQSKQTRSATWRVLISCKYYSYFIPCYNLQYMYMLNFSSLRRIYAEYSNSTTK